MVNRLFVLAFLLALGFASSAAAQESCWYCECDSSGCYCIQVICPSAAPPNDPVFDENSHFGSPDEVVSQLFSRFLATAPVGAHAMTIEGPSLLEDGSSRWNLVWTDSHDEFLSFAGFATSYKSAHELARKAASRHGVELIDRTHDK